MKYEKLPYTSEQHVHLLKERGLLIEDEARAIRYLENISYFRLSGYMFRFQNSDGSHKFQDNITFNDIILEYHFDKKLKLLILEYIARIEVALRAQLCNKFSITHGFFWYRNRDLYQDMVVFNEINAHIASYYNDPPDKFLKHFKYKYTSETNPPSNMAMEILTFGKISRLYTGLKNNEEKQAISAHFGLPFSVLSSWFIFLTMVRNICAHHARLWNKNLTANRFLIPQREKFKFHGNIPNNFNTSVYGAVSIIDRLLKNINPTNTFIEKLLALLELYKEIDVKNMGFVENWKEESVWK